MNNLKKEMIKRELKNATEEELNEILGSLLEIYNETYLKFLDSQIEKRKKEKEEYEKMVKAETITIMPYAK